MIGGCGFCTGVGMAYTSAKWKKFPAKLTGPPLPQRLHNLYVLPGALAPLGEIFPQGVKLLLEPTDPHAKEKAPAGHHIHRGDRLGYVQGIAVGNDEDACAQKDLLRLCRYVTQKDERVRERGAAGETYGPIL